MPEKHKLGPDGYREDGVSYYPADAHDLQTYEDAKRTLGRFNVPLILHVDNPNERLYIAAFDGTGNDAVNDPNHATNIADVNARIKALPTYLREQIKSGYVEGPGTQQKFVASAWDGARGHSYDERIQTMYSFFREQVEDWKTQNPQAEIRLVSIGFSRGAEQAAGFTRMVHERGIPNPDGAEHVRNSRGEVVNTHYTKPPLVAPGQIAQAVVLLDPVGTGEPVEKHDRRLPPSVISGLQLTAEDERRSLFKSTHIIDPGLSEDGRLLGLVVGGAHSDIGGSYHRDGLSIRAGNLMANYLNQLSDTPFLPKHPEPIDVRRNVVHRSEEGMVLYRITEHVDRLKPEGYVERLVPTAQLSHVVDGYNAEAVDRVLREGFQQRPVMQGTTPQEPAPYSLESRAPSPFSAPTPSAETATQPWRPFNNPFANEAVRAALANDDAAFDRVARQFAASPEGQRMEQLGRDLLQAERQQQALEQQQQQHQQRGRSL